MFSPKKIVAQLKPPHWYSWRTSILLSGISGILSVLARLLGTQPFSVIAWLIAFCGWFFLLVGISWAITEQGGRFSAWVTGAVFCFFFFGQIQTSNWQQALITWPLVSAGVFALPYFWDESLTKKLPKIEERITILLVIGSQLIVSFWLQFFIVLSTFITDYPSLYSDDLSESLFIVRSPTRRAPDPKGVFILDLLEGELIDYFGDRPWGEVQAKLINDPAEPVDRLLATVIARTPDLKEDQYWQLRTPVVLTEGQGYTLVLQYAWREDAPKARLEEDYYVEKTCTLTPTKDSTGEQITAIACQATKVHGWLAGELD